jgi:hypothetical protein
MKSCFSSQCSRLAPDRSLALACRARRRPNLQHAAAATAAAAMTTIADTPEWQALAAHVADIEKT